MTTKEAFELGFLARLAEKGVTPGKFEKRAIWNLPGQAMAALGPLGILAAVGLISAPIVGGTLTGVGSAETENITKEDIQRMKARDIVDAYDREAQRIRSRLRRDEWKKRPTRGSDDF